MPKLGQVLEAEGYFLPRSKPDSDVGFAQTVPGSSPNLPSGSDPNLARQLIWNGILSPGTGQSSILDIQDELRGHYRHLNTVCFVIHFNLLFLFD